MQIFGILLIPALMQISGSFSSTEKARLMKEIDGIIRLPPRAMALHKYARYYAVRPDRKIAILLDGNTKFEGKRPKDYGCSEVMPDDTLKDVPCPPDNRPKADEQFWVEFDYLPLINDGGCNVIDAVYDPQTKIVEKVSCHGEA